LWLSRLKMLVTLQKRSFRWFQDLDGEMKIVEFYLVNDYSQVSARNYRWGGARPLSSTAEPPP